jgi:hypothetical protein
MAKQLKVGVFGQDCRPDKIYLLEHLFDKLSTLGVDLYLQSEFHTFIKQTLNPPQASILETGTYDIDVA